jgi:hypothetical protein
MNTSLLTRTPTIISIAAITLAMVILVMHLPPIIQTFRLSHGDVIDEINASFAKLTDAHHAQQALHAERFKGRSIFFMPVIRTAAPPPNPGPPIIRDPEPQVVDVTPAPPPPPRTYSGPAIHAFDGDRVWFANGELIKVGEESGGIRVISVNAPWSVEIAHAGWQGKVELFPEFDPDRVFRNAITTSGDLADIAGSGQSSPPTPASTTRRGATPGRPTATPSRGRGGDGSPPE